MKNIIKAVGLHARSKKEIIRKALEYVQVMSDRVVATDGHTLADFPNIQELPDGSYKKIKGKYTKVDVLDKFPTWWKSVVPTHVTKFDFNCIWSSMDEIKRMSKIDEACITLQASHRDIQVNANLLLRCLTSLELAGYKNIQLEYDNGYGYSSILLRSGDAYVVVMPQRSHKTINNINIKVG